MEILTKDGKVRKLKTSRVAVAILISVGLSYGAYKGGELGINLITSGIKNTKEGMDLANAKITLSQEEQDLVAKAYNDKSFNLYYDFDKQPGIDFFKVNLIKGGSQQAFMQWISYNRDQEKGNFNIIINSDTVLDQVMYFNSNFYMQYENEVILSDKNYQNAKTSGEVMEVLNGKISFYEWLQNNNEKKDEYKSMPEKWLTDISAVVIK